jgi:hypothetical protein
MYTYTDNLQIYHSWPRDMLSECIQKVNCDLRKIFEWSRVNFLRWNSAKPTGNIYWIGPLPVLYLNIFTGEDTMAL